MKIAKTRDAQHADVYFDIDDVVLIVAPNVLTAGNVNFRIVMHGQFFDVPSNEGIAILDAWKARQKEREITLQ